MSFSRRTLLKASAASAVLGGIGAPFVARAQTAEFSYKYANNLPDAHPLNIRAKESGGDQGRDQRPGRHPDLPEQPARLRHRHAEPGALGRHRVLHAVGAGLATLVPAASINGIGFAFPDYDRSGRPWTASSAPMSAARSPSPTSWSWTRSGTTASARPRRRPSRSTAPRISRASRSACRSRRSASRCSRRSMPRPPRSISAKSIRRCRPRSSTARKTRWRSSRRRSCTRCRNTAR